jgi:hypothetical protein
MEERDLRRTARDDGEQRADENCQDDARDGKNLSRCSAVAADGAIIPRGGAG